MYISTKAKWMIIGLGSTLACAGAAAAGWAVISHYKENTKTPSEHLKEALELKITPDVSSKMSNYSSEWMSLYSTNDDFDFKKIIGYEPSLEYKITSKTSLATGLEVGVKVTNSNAEFVEYTTKLTNIFATPEMSAKTVIEETIIDFPRYTLDIAANPDSVTPGETITPSSILINSNDFTLDKDGAYRFVPNGAKIKSTLTIDINSTKELVQLFIDKFKELGTTLTDSELNKEIETSISLGKTIILFEVSDGFSPRTSGTISIQDFSQLDSSNFVENAAELNVILGDKIGTPPTAQEVIKSIAENNPNQYLVFDGMPSLPKFDYKIDSVKLDPKNIAQDELIVTIIISQDKSINTKVYTSKLTGLLSIQQKQLNDITTNDPFSKWAITPTVTFAFQNKTIKEIINSKDFSAFRFKNTVYPDFEYSIIWAEEIEQSGKSAINVNIQITSKENNKATFNYSKVITKGFKPS